MPSGTGQVTRRWGGAEVQGSHPGRRPGRSTRKPAFREVRRRCRDGAVSLEANPRSARARDFAENPGRTSPVIGSLARDRADQSRVRPKALRSAEIWV